FKTEVASVQRKLDTIEARMPSGDVYRWIIRTFTGLQTNDVEIANLEAPRMSDVNILPKVPYKAATFTLSGTAHYHDFGTFLSSLENSYPHMRLQRLELEPTQLGDADGVEQERLIFKLEIVALVKPSASAP
ncbi:MAG TPA: hypothetical protein VFA77_05440, partial [Candidatus Eisenbacteria bacterium]|nr:hypothetical protein [Candidatus Eisenbacteria bacterium]